MNLRQTGFFTRLTLFTTLIAVNACSRSEGDAKDQGIDGPNSPAATTSTRADEATDPENPGSSPTGNNDATPDPDNPDSSTQAPDNNDTNENSTSTGSTGTQDTGTHTDTNASSSSTSTNNTNAQGQLLCGSKVYACGDGIDNDADGKVDLDDPECISPCDDTEATFATALPGQNSDCKSDCYFDSDSGGGNDKCDFNLKCDLLSPAANIGCTHDPALTSCEASVPQTCLDVCLPLVPNGCDCFGCCEVKSSTGNKFIYLGSSEGCNLDNLDSCASCTFNPDCSNTCNRQECELCFGDEKLPDHCTKSSCPDGVKSCSTSSDCSTSEFCLTGCCVFSPG